MHCYTTLAILVLAASAVSPAVSAPVRDSVRQDARDPNLGNVPESIGAHGIIQAGEQLRRGLRLPIRRGRFMDGANLGMMAFSILQGLLPKHSSTATSGSTTSSGGSGSNAHVNNREEVDLVLRQMGKRSITLVDAIAELYKRDLTEEVSRALKPVSRTLDELD